MYNFMIQILLCFRGSVGIVRQEELIDSSYKFYLDKQQYNNAKRFHVHVLEIKEVENFHKCFKYAA